MIAVIRSDDVRKGNRRRVLAAVRRGGALSRTDIRARTGLSAATVSAISGDLIAERVLERPAEAGPAATGRGRPKIALAVNANAARVGVAMLQLNEVSAAIVDYAGETVSHAAVTLDTTVASADELRAAMIDTIAMAAGRTGIAPSALRRFAVGVQGVTDVDGTDMLWSPITRVRDVPMRRWLESAFGAPAHVSNDCDMIAQALNWRHPDRYGADFAAVLLSHGVGMGLFLGGRLVNGTRSSGTEFGHMIHEPGGALCRCGSRGCIEAYAGDYAIERRAQGLAPDTPPPGLMHEPDVAAIADAARRGDAQARQAIADAGRALGTGLANLYALVDPFPVALVGHATSAFDVMEPHLRDALAATMAGREASDVAIDCFVDERPLVLEGCAISALLELDAEIAGAASEAISA